MVRVLCQSLAVAAVAIAATGCAVVASPVGNGVLFTAVHGPVDATEATGATKEGRACAANYLGLIAIGDASIEHAKQSASISQVSSVDHESFAVLSIFSSFCTVVKGN